MAYDVTLDAMRCQCGNVVSFVQWYGVAGNASRPKKQLAYYCTKCGDVFTDINDDLCDCKSIAIPLYLEDEVTAQQANIRIWWDASVSAYRMTSPFNRELVDAIKAFIPVSDRSYDPNSKVWTFVEKQLGPLTNLMSKLHCSPVIVTRQQVESASQSSPTQQRGKPLAEIALEFIKLAGPDAMTRAYRHAAMLHHPDRGGDMSKMSALNAAWDRLTKEALDNGQQ